ncbi:MAG: 16S rRNA (uracil(1498)-N(3))-methyltransferase [Vulcanibacillus sp.]
MQRYFVDPKLFSEDKVIIIGEDAHHITKVLRCNIGDKIICCNNGGLDVITEIIYMSFERVETKIISIIKQDREPLVKITLAQALPKSDKMDFIIQKGTEIGVTTFLPFNSERTIVQLNQQKEQKKIGRWEKIAKEAAEQSHRSRIPNILPIVNYKELIGNFKNRIVLIAYEREVTTTLFKAIENMSELKEILLIIGPEGGFSDQEVELASKNGAISISLGRRILRAETAGLVGVANILYHYEKS